MLGTVDINQRQLARLGKKGARGSVSVQTPASGPVMARGSRELGGLTVGSTPGAINSKWGVSIVVEHRIAGRDWGIARGGPVDEVRVECVHRVWPSGAEDREQKIVSIIPAMPQINRNRDARGDLRGSRSVTRDLGVTRRREGGVRSGEDEAEGDEERHNPDAEDCSESSQLSKHRGRSFLRI